MKFGQPALLIVAAIPVILATIGSMQGIQAIDDAKQEWDHQLAVYSFESDLQSLNALMEAASVGEGGDHVDYQTQRVRSDFKLLIDWGPERDLRRIRSRLNTLLGLYDKTVGLAQQKRYAEARQLDSDVSDRIFESIIVDTRAYESKLQRQAQANHARSIVFGLIGAISSSLFASLLFVGYQRRRQQVATAVNEKKYWEASERRLSSLLTKNEDIIAVLGPEGNFALVTGACQRLLGRDPEMLVGHTPESICHPNDEGLIKYYLRRTYAEEEELRTEVRLSDGNGGYRPYRVHFGNLIDHPDVRGIVLTLHDLSERKAFEQELSHQAFHDLLTGLPNRALFTDQLAQRIARSRTEDDELVVMFLDLDNFKLINDTLGHELGDKLLVAVAERLQRSLDSGTMLARIGGDEFVVLGSVGTSMAMARGLAYRLIKSLREPFLLGNREIFASCSIGIACAQGPGADADALLREADTAMYQAKAEGKSSFAVFTPEMNDQAVERLDLESDLRKAIAAKQLVLHFQPIVDLSTLGLRQFEVLLRWQHPTRGLISPLKFIPIAEETGLICEIGLWVMRQACAQLALWNRGREAHERISMSINVSGRQLQDPTFVRAVKSVLEETQVEPSTVEIEITESVMLQDFEQSLSVLGGLRELGVRIAIDDFGTGYSSMSYLSRLPIDKLKIDRSFINALTEDHGEHIVRAIIAMAKNLKLTVTSEGIENRIQQRLLQVLGCELGQGFLYARPMPAADVDALLRLEGPISRRNRAA